MACNLRRIFHATQEINSEKSWKNQGLCTCHRQKLPGYVIVCWERWSLHVGGRKKTGFQGNGENLQ